MSAPRVPEGWTQEQAPRAEGSAAPLWEWVREAMAPPREVRPYTVRDGWWSFDYGYHGASLVPWGQGWCAEVFVHGDGVPLARCATPAELRTQLDRLATMRTLAELRAALDKLAAEVKP